MLKTLLEQGQELQLDPAVVIFIDERNYPLANITHHEQAVIVWLSSFFFPCLSHMLCEQAT
jgi:hypothetical protein